MREGQAAGPSAADIAALRLDSDMTTLRSSLDAYYGDPVRQAAMDRLYARFMAADDIAFDIGAHVGDRIGSFRRLGARVVAVEPQPLCARAIRTLFADDHLVTVVEAACGARVGTARLRINSANPTVSTVSPEFVDAARDAVGWEGQVWDEEIEVPMSHLDTLIARFGPPAFVKIDVEGYEDQVLAGLTHTVPALSFEFTTIRREVALHCLDRLSSLGPYRFDVSLGETHRLVFGRWVSSGTMAAHLLSLPHESNAGDVYCTVRWTGPPRPGDGS